MMPEKTPLDYPAIQYALVIFLGAIGGLVARLQRISGNDVHCWKCAAFRIVVDMITSGFCGVLAFWACESLNIPQLMTAVVIGICGHMGSRALFLAEKHFSEKMFNSNSGSNR